MNVFDMAIIILFVCAFISIPIWILYFYDRRPSNSTLLHTFESSESYVTFPWGRIWVFDSHPGAPPEFPTVVFIHSMGGSIYSWRHQIPDFQKKYRVIAFDLLGFGKSDKPLSESYELDAQETRVLALMDHLDIRRCALVGCSLGGAIALWLASRDKDRFTHIAVLAPAALNTLVPYLPLQLKAMSLVASRIVSRAVIRLALRNSFSNPKIITPEVIENYYSPYSDTNAATCFLRTAETIRDARIYKCLPSISVPTLILWGNRDRVIPHHAITRICKALPNARTEIHATGGHHLMEDEPQWVNEKILSFLDESRFSDVATVPSKDPA